jgi:hypothetical protein
MFADLGLSFSSAITIYLTLCRLPEDSFEKKKTERGTIIPDEALLSISNQLIRKNVRHMRNMQNDILTIRLLYVIHHDKTEFACFNLL